MRIPDHIVDQIRDSIDIVEVVSDYVSLKKRGINFFGLCPFHNEKTPSFSVNPERGIYKCFGCGKGGNAYSFLMEVEHIGFVEAVRLLSERAGIPLPEPTTQDSEAASEIESLYHALRMAGRYFHTQLGESEAGKTARSYLESRGFTREVITKFGLGYAPDEWDGLIRHAESQSASIDHLHKAGLVVKREKSDGYYDRFRGRVMFPLFSHVGQVVGFTGRLLDETVDQPKYVNTPETKVYHKGRILYGLNFSKNEIRRLEEAYLVEGNTDVVSLVQAGIQNVAATSGTALTPAQVQLLGRYTGTVILLFDADEAGIQASLRSLDLFLEAGMRAYVLTLPEGSDPDSYVRENGRDGFLDYAHRHRTDFVSFRLKVAGFERNSGDPESDWDAIRKVLSSINLIPNNVRQEGYLRLTAEQTGMPEGTLRSELRSMSRKSRRRTSTRHLQSEAQSRSAGTPPPSSQSRPEVDAEASAPRPLPAELHLLRLMLNHGERMIGFILANMSLDEFSAGSSRRLAELLLEMYKKGEVDTNDLVSGDVDDAIRSLAAGLLIQTTEPSPNWESVYDIEVPRLDADAKRSAADAMRRLKLTRVDMAITDQNRKIFSAEKEGESLTEHLRELQSLQALRKHVREQEFVEWG